MRSKYDYSGAAMGRTDQICQHALRALGCSPSANIGLVFIVNAVNHQCSQSVPPISDSTWKIVVPLLVAETK
jgi:hypothetical protein